MVVIEYKFGFLDADFTGNLCLEERYILDCLGYRGGKEPSLDTLRRLRELMTRLDGCGLIALGTSRMVDDFRINNAGIITPYGDIKSFRISSFANRRNIVGISVGLVTLDGFLLDRSQDLLQDYIIHGIGSAAVEKAEDELIKIIEEQTGYYASLPFAPGYCDWGFAKGQRFILRLLDPSIIGVHIDPKNLIMTPIYTISFMVLLSPEKMDKNPCHYCDNAGCPMRRA